MKNKSKNKQNMHNTKSNCKDSSKQRNNSK